MFNVNPTVKPSPAQTLAAAVALAAAGAYLRRGVAPVIASYRVGREVERLIARPARLATALQLGYRFGHHDRAAARDAA